MQDLGEFPFTVGPMVGLTHVAFRELIRQFTPPNIKPLLFTEMLSTLRLPSERFDLADELQVSQLDRGRVTPQILGNDEDYIAKSLRKLEIIEPWGVDINMGCPVKKTLRHNWGVRLMGDKDFAGEVVAKVRRHYDGPLSVKLRCGIEVADLDFIKGFTEVLEKNGADWITIHARLKADKHKGLANWGLLRELKQFRKIPLIGNGDLQTADDAYALVKDYGLDGGMFGRAATARPWVLWQLAEKLGMSCERPEAALSDHPPKTPEEDGQYYLIAMETFAGLLDRYFQNEARKMRKFRFLVTTSHKWCVFGNSFYRRCMKIKTWSEMAPMIADYRASLSGFPMRSRISMLH